MDWIFNSEIMNKNHEIKTYLCRKIIIENEKI